MRRRRWRLRGTVVTTTVVALSLAGAVPGAANPPGDSPTIPAPAGPTAGTTTKVTLLTGDVVEYTVDRDGKRRVALSPASGPDRLGVSYLQVPEGDSYYVYPSDALPLIEAGRIDRTLFDVAYLAENGFGDATAAELPVIAQYGATVRGADTLAAKADALPASSDVSALPSVRGAGFDVDKEHAGEFWSAVTGSSAKARTRATTLSAGVSKLWMDRLVTPTLDRSTAQIGAPAAWQRGLDGKGTKVAVLDTGLDLDHPDFAGRVLATENFTSDASVHDGFGHGTHVASIVAGSGAASGGKYRGVAPGASLMIGKVLSDGGTGSTEDVIKGMEWAAANNADVINMSLGGGPTDGTDLQSMAVNNLTAQYGSLFVVAAGNSGPQPHTVSSPGTADAALTVAAVDRDDKMASFSSRGPREGDFGLKPDIAAPGVQITAARSEPSIMGGDPGARYHSVSGTSMASPHVAGAAAILNQQNPKWTAAELKPVLVSTAKDAGHRGYEQGAGTLDVDRATTQRVHATNNLDFGKLAHPQTAAVDRTVSYVNRSDKPVTLDLEVSLSSESGPAPAGMVRLDKDTVTVPANGAAKVTATVDATLGEPTWYEGAVRASADGIEVGTAIGLYKEPESFEVTGKVILPKGAPETSVGTFAFTRDDDRLDRTTLAFGDSATETKVRLHAGPHTATVILSWVGEDGFNDAIAMRPEFEVNGDTTVTIDMRRVQAVKVKAPKDTDTYSSAVTLLRLGKGNVGGVQAFITGSPGEGWKGWVMPTERVRIGSLDMVTQHVLGAPPIKMSVAGRHGPELHARYSTPAGLTLPRLDGRRTLPLVNGGTGAAADLAGVNARGALVLLDLSELCQQTMCEGAATDRVAEVAKAGAAAVIAYGPRGHVMVGAGEWPIYAVPTMAIPTDEARMLLDRLARGPVRVDARGTATSPYRYQLVFTEGGRVPRDVEYEVTERQLYRIDHRFHSDAPATVTQRYSAKHKDRMVAAIMYTPQNRAQSTLTEYIGPVSEDVVWDRDASYSYDEPDENGWQTGPFYSTSDVFARPGSTTETWNSRPLSTGPFDAGPETGDNPWLTKTCYTCRVGDTMVVDTSTLDPSGHNSAYVFRQERYRLTRDDTEFTHKQRGYLVNALFFLLRIPVDTFDVPADRGTYRLEHQTLDKPFPQMRYSTTEKSAYTFRSARPDGQFESCVGQMAIGRAEPCGADKILRLRYDIALDLANTVKAGTSQRITVSGYYGNGLDAPKLRGLDLWASADDGKTWAKVRMSQRNGTFSGDIRHPALSASTGAITLRAKGVDVNGNTIEQTIDRAYGLR